MITAAENPTTWRINGYLNVSQTTIMNDGNHSLLVNYDITTDYPADYYTVLISNALAGEAFKTTGDIRILQSRTPDGRINIKGSQTFLVDRTWAPSDYFVHMQFKSNGGTRLDAGLYERFEVKPFGYLNIYKFDDLNRNGKLDNGEPPLPGWRFTVTEPNATQTYLTTDSQGRAHLGPIYSGDYTLAEELKTSSWNHTGTEIVTENLTNPSLSTYKQLTDLGKIDVTVGPYESVSTYFGNRLKNASLTLSAFYDYNGDGRQNGILEPGTARWAFTVNGGPGNKSYTAPTNGNVLNLPTSEEGAIYHIRETLPNDKWECTTPPIEKQVILRPGASDSVEYGNRLKPAVIGITKFRDYNGNGLRESDEKGLSWRFNISGTDGSKNTVSTNDNGRAEHRILFPVPEDFNAPLPVRSYLINEEPKQNWRLTTPPFNGPVSVGPGSLEEVPAFGNYLSQTFNISKFNDTNRNGIHDSGENWVPGWKFLIEDSSGNSMINETDSHGNITIRAKPNTGYTVTEYLQPNWEPTTATQQNLTTDSETPEFAPMIFGNSLEQWIGISKFEDTHNRGKRDSDERGIGGWEFDITGPINDQGNRTARVTTDEEGNVTYKCPVPGRYIIKEVKMSSCWISTTSEMVVVDVPAGKTVPVEFGNYQVCHGSYANALQNQDVEVRKFVDPSVLTTDMIGKCGDAYLNYTIEVHPKEKAQATDLVIAINEMVPRTESSQRTIDTVVNGVAGFLDEQARESNPSSKVGLIGWIGTGSKEILPNTNYTDLKNNVKDSQFIQTNTTSAFADWTYGIIDKFYNVSSPDTKKILVLVTDGDSRISRPTEILNANYTIHAIAIGGRETDTVRLLRNLTSEHHGKLYLANDSAELQDALTKLALVTRPTVLKSVQLIDTLPSYLEPVDYQVNPPDSKNITENNDGRDWRTTTMKWWVGNLSSSGRPWNTSFTVRFCWVVPADIHQKDVAPRVSQVNYVREDGSMAAIPVPEGAISFSKSATPVPRIVPGFEVLFSLVGLLVLAYTFRRR